MMENNIEPSNKGILHQSKKIKTTEDSIGIMPHLHEDVITQILIRLPVKSLLKFKFCVAKSWLHLISSPKFIKAHVERSALDPTFANHRIMLGISYDPVRDDLNRNSVSCAVRDLLTDADNFPYQRSEWRSVISGSCDGLLCVSVFRNYDRTAKHVFLWNPFLKMSKKLPPLAGTEKVWSSTYGVGYDERNDDYKVLGLFLCFPHGGDEFECMVQIYSLKNDSWNRIQGFEGGVESFSSVIYANGKFHFLAFFILDQDHTRCKIMSLDLENCVYGTIKEPKYDDSDISIGVLRGCITALYSCGRDCTDVWILKQYGVGESWTKLVSIPYVDGPCYDYMSSYRLCALLNGKYLLGHGSYLVVYDPEDDSFVFPGKGSVDEISSMGVYVESLVPC